MANTVIHSFKTISTESSLVLANWLPFELKALQLAVLAFIKMSIGNATLFPGHVQFI